LTLRVCDNGCGFDVAYQTEDVSGQLGLISMKERAAELGGRLRVAVGSTGGTEVELVVPAAFRPAEA
jgi:signal transduction histidine kinase